MATIGFIVRELDSTGVKPGSSCYFKELRKTTLSYYNMREDQLSGDTASKLESQFKKMAWNLKKMYSASSSCVNTMLSKQADKVRQF